jgi:Repeat of unknown function (DUF346)
MRAIAATSWGPNELGIFFLESDFSMRYNAWNGIAWTGAYDLGGTFASVPAATSGGTSAKTARADVFAVGTDYAIYHKAIVNGVLPAAWENLGGIFASAPAAIAWDGQVDVFGVGLDRAMYRKTWDGTAWSPQWERLGEAFSSEAYPISWGPNRLDVFARGADYSLRHRSHDGSAWTSDWQNLGGSLASPPVAVSWGVDRLDIFAIGTDGQLCHRWWDGQIWNDWESLPTAPLTPLFASPPTATAMAPERMDVFAVGTDAVVRHLSWTNGSWNPWEDIGGAMTSGPTAITPATDHIEVFGPGTDHNLYRRTWDGTAWNPAGWEYFGPVQMPERYRFSVDLVKVDTARSSNIDTDYGQCSVRAGNWPTRTVNQTIGDIGGTDYKEFETNLLYIDPVDLDFCEPATFNYSVINNGHDSAEKIDTLLTKSAEQLIEGVTTIGSPLVDYLLDSFFSVVFAGCDGWVAVDQHSFTGRDLHIATADGPSTITQTYPGYTSPDGCWGNSLYEITWTVQRSAL